MQTLLTSSAGNSPDLAKRRWIQSWCVWMDYSCPSCHCTVLPARAATQAGHRAFATLNNGEKTALPASLAGAVYTKPSWRRESCWTSLSLESPTTFRVNIHLHMRNLGDPPNVQEDLKMGATMFNKLGFQVEQVCYNIPVQHTQPLLFLVLNHFKFYKLLFKSLSMEGQETGCQFKYTRSEEQ